MANTIISPNMNLPVPVVSVDPGPDWANNINACLGIVDSHNHTPGQGVQITPQGLNISSDLTFQGNNATNLRSTRFTPQASPLSGGSDIGCLYESGVDLYYNDGSGNQVRITQSGAVTGASGTITGLPSGTASASYSGSTFTFQSATNTPADMAIGPIVLGYPTASSKTITISPTSGQPSSYNLNLPSAAPANAQIMVSDGSGNLTWLSGYFPAGNFTATYNGVSGTVTQTWYYSCVGGVVVVVPSGTTQAVTKNSISGPITITGVPSQLLPSTTILTSGIGVSYNDGGSPTGYPIALCYATTSGFTITRDNGGDSFGNGTQSTILSNSFTYAIR